MLLAVWRAIKSSVNSDWGCIVHFPETTTAALAKPGKLASARWGSPSQPLYPPRKEDRSLNPYPMPCLSLDREKGSSAPGKGTWHSEVLLRSPKQCIQGYVGDLKRSSFYSGNSLQNISRHKCLVHSGLTCLLACPLLPCHSCTTKRPCNL